MKHAVVAAFSFLTRLPVPRGALRPEAFGPALVWFPLVGLVLGAAQALVGLALSDRLGATLAAIAVVTLSVVLTAGLHIDGLADVCDGLGGSGGDSARALAIMRDSRIGAFGAVAIVLVVLTKVAALDPLLAAGAIRPILVAPIAARSAAVLLIVAFPYARPEGLGRSFHDHGRRHHLFIAALITALLVWAANPSLLLALLATWLLAICFGLWLRRRLGGLTGDAYGAAIELCELVFLTVAVGSL